MHIKDIATGKGTRPGGRTVVYIIRYKFVVEIQGTDALEEEIARTQEPRVEMDI